MDIKRKEQENKISIPEQSFRDPSQLVSDTKLSWNQKMTALKNWEMDEKSALVADDENLSIEKPAGHGDMLEKIHAAKRELREAPHPVQESDMTETRLLTENILMNIDACVFYRQAADKVMEKSAKEACLDLEKMHSLVIAELQAALKKNGALPAEADNTTLNQYSVFRELFAVSVPVFDVAFISIIQKAEDVCSSMVENMLNNGHISENAHFHLACAAHLLQRKYDYLNALGKQ